jgi:hypothetical protein
MAMTSKVIVLMAALIAAPVVAAKSDISAADQKLLSGYALSLDTLHKYERAIAAVDAACSKDPKLREEDAAARPDESLDKAIQRVGKSTFYTRYLKPAGLEAKDAVLLPVVLIGAAAVVEMNADASKLPGLSAQQVDFYRSHQAEIKKMKLTGQCGQEE